MIALGLEDAVVAIYNVRLDVVQHSMKSHEAAVTGAAWCRSICTVLIWLVALHMLTEML